MEGDGSFPTTHWTLISRLKSDDENGSHRALDEICTQYQFPLYCYIRRRGLAHHDAQDALHDFLVKLLRLESLKSADATKGRLRTFLATALQRFLINWQRDAHHRRQEISIEATDEARYQRENFSDAITPEMALDRIWAATLLQATLNELTEAESKAGRRAQFTALEPFLSPAGEAADYGLAAGTLGQTEGTIRQWVKRLRGKFRKHLRKHIAETLSNPSEWQIDEEMKSLRKAMMRLKFQPVFLESAITASSSHPRPKLE